MVIIVAPVLLCASVCEERVTVTLTVVLEGEDFWDVCSQNVVCKFLGPASETDILDRYRSRPSWQRLSGLLLDLSSILPVFRRSFSDSESSVAPWPW